LLSYHYINVNNLIQVTNKQSPTVVETEKYEPLKTILFALLCIISLNASAQITDTAKKNIGDTIKKNLLTAPDTVKKLHSNPLSLIAPAVLITYGALSFEVKPIRNLDYYIHGRIEKYTPNFNTTAESYFLFAPVALVYGLDVVGVSGKNTFIDQTAILGLSGGFLGVTELSLKHVTHRLRPNGADYYSFPSGHTGAAFLAAEFLAQEYSEKSPVYTVIGYTFAVTTGIFRMANRDHWLSDVVAGAGFGILSTKAAYLVYPYIRNALTHKGKNGKSAMVMPTYINGAPGLSFAMQL
jgi:membrane-associated phospholipid phosphatase